MMLKETKKNHSEGEQNPDNLNLKTNPKRMTNFFRKKSVKVKLQNTLSQVLLEIYKFAVILKMLKLPLKKTRTQSLHNKIFY